eukprot:CAMPEP_0116542046 /NCGR_PEP_ID=MMETSP0397-20121206/806_1 /TAXON_ID=216820 /ORGANISM="Cyclophora tenuis, Strain ECT3854" /LENGTH=403 /DNA_ID=CAMNT_0004066027 /DNA_START=129 /DNA_END=1340 /DNA_ORIENTATION=-
MVDRSVDRAFEVMENLACLHAEKGSWDVAVDVLRTLVMRCEQYLPIYHPMTLSALLDLSASLIESSREESARLVIARASKRLAFYLSEQEEHFLDAQTDWTESGERVSFQPHSASDFVSMLEEFTKALQRLMGRPFVRLLDANNSVLLLNHTILGDASAVLANCLGFVEQGQERSSSYWCLSYQSYRRAFEGWASQGQSLGHPNISTVACGIARCLRERGEIGKAIKILTTVLSARKGGFRATTTTRKKVKTKTASPFPMVTYMPPNNRGRNALSSVAWTLADDHQVNALCLWSLAVYSVEMNPSERGRIRALSLLHDSADAIRKAIEEANRSSSQQAELKDMMVRVESEAKELFQPLQAAEDESVRQQTKALRGESDGNPMNDFRRRLEETARRIHGRFVSA